MTDYKKETMVEFPDTTDMKAEAIKEAKFASDTMKI